MTLKPGDTVRIKTTIEVEYDIQYFPEAYPGAETAGDVAGQEEGFIEGEGDYFISMLGLAHSFTTTAVTGTATAGQG